MSNLSNRVQKAKKLRIIPAVDGSKGCYNTWGSNDDLYKICLTSDEKNLITPDGYRPTKVFYASCTKSLVDVNNPYHEDCQFCRGNNQHTVCYHCIGTIWWSLKQVGLQVSFYETYHDAINGLNFGGKLAKIENQNGTGSIWCVYRKPGDKKEKQEFYVMPRMESPNFTERVELLRGNEADEEGID